MKIFFKFIVYFPIFPFLLLIVLINKIVLIRFGCLISERIGHFGCVTELYLCNKKKVFGFPIVIDFFCFNSVICNNRIAKYCRQELHILPRRIVLSFLFFIRLFPFLKRHDIFNQGSDIENYNFFMHRDINNILDDSKKNFYFSDTEIATSKKILAKLDLLNNKKKAIFFHRDNFFFEKYLENKSYKYLSTKNTNILDYELCVKMLLDNDYQVIRLGKGSNKDLNIFNSSYLDLTNHPMKTDLLEMYLISKCDIIFGPNSGALYNAVYLFRKPCFVSNYIPYAMFHSYSKFFMYNFKKYKCLVTNKVLNLSEVFNRGDLAYNEHIDILIKERVSLIDQSPEEMTASLKEMILKESKSNSEINEEKLLKNKFTENLFYNLKKKRNFKLHGDIRCSFGYSYLKNNPHLYL